MYEMVLKSFLDEEVQVRPAYMCAVRFIVDGWC